MTMRRRPINPVPPWLRPMLRADQVRDLGLAHIVNLDAIHAGNATPEILWQWCGGALTWSRVADLLQRTDRERYREATEAMAEQLNVCTAVIERWRATGRIEFSQGEYDTARRACDWMDALAEHVDRATAIAAAEWSEAEINARMEAAT